MVGRISTALARRGTAAKVVATVSFPSIARAELPGRTGRLRCAFTAAERDGVGH